jgi:hypothetical protein
MLFLKTLVGIRLQRQRFVALSATALKILSIIAYSIETTLAYSAKKYKLAIFRPEPSQF